MSIKESLEKAAYTGLGLAVLTRDKLEETIESLKNEKGMSEEEGRKFAEEIKDNADSARRNLDDRIETTVKKVLKTMGLATVGEVKELRERIEELETSRSKGKTPAK